MLARQPGGQRCAEVHASRTALRSFQLESLILAQNERWRQLHRLVYPAAVLGGVHYLWLVKAWPPEPFVYLGAILVLLALRLRR